MRTRAAFILLVLLLSGSVLGQDPYDFSTLDWELKRDKQGVQIYTATMPDSKYKAVKSVMLAPGTVQEYTALVLDTDSCSQWAHLCKHSNIEQQISINQSYVYTYNDLPFPVSDRDVLAKVTWHYDVDNGKVTMSSYATQEIKEPTKAIRIKHGHSQWHFTPQDDQVLIEGFAHIDPNGATPAWLTNILLVDSPYKTALAMKQQIESGKYAKTPVEFMQP